MLPHCIPMKNQPIYENLDTSFINLSALIKYLRRRQFAGSIRIELSGYEADVNLNGENHLTVREHDRISGRVAEGEEALQRLLIRAREPGGIIHVYQKADTAPVTEKAAPEVMPEPALLAAEMKTPVSNGEKNFYTSPAESEVIEQIAPKAPFSLPDFPFKLSNDFESKAKKNNLSPQDWQTLVNLLGEFLGTVERHLAMANLNFAAVFQKTCEEVAADYPFLHQEKEIFQYKHGKITMREQVNSAIFAAAVLEILRRILEKLGANPKYQETYCQTVQRIFNLLGERKPLYDKFSITSAIERIIGV